MILVLPGVLALNVVTGVGLVRAEDDAPAAITLLLTASDFSRLAAEGVPFAAETAHLKVWSADRRAWSRQADSDPVTLVSSIQGTSEGPRWRDLGSISIRNGRLVLRIEGDSDAAPGPVPTLLLISTDPKAGPGPLMDLARGDLNAVKPLDDPRRETIRTLDDSTVVEPPTTLAAWRHRADDLRRQVSLALGQWPPLTTFSGLAAPMISKPTPRDGYTIETVVLETLPGHFLAGNLYRPSTPGPTGRHPAVLCPHGHWEDGRLNENVQMRCIGWARMGAVVFAYDMVGYTDSKPFGHAFLNPRLERWGLSLTGLQTHNSRAALTWMASRPDVDSARIACTGASGGGTQTILLTAIDDRVTACAPVVMVSEAMQGGSKCENAAGLRIDTNNVELAALAAPRPQVIVGATGDWTARTMTRAYPPIRRVYELYGRPDNVEAHVFDFPHNYNATSRMAVYRFLAPRLLGIDPPETNPERDSKPEAEAVLRDLKVPDMATPEQLEATLVKALSDFHAANDPASNPMAWLGARPTYQAALTTRVGIRNPSLHEVEAKQTRRVAREDVDVLHEDLALTSRGVHLPIVTIAPKAKRAGAAVVVFSPRGKAALLGPDGKTEPQVRALLDQGLAVVAFDPLFVGESADSERPARARPQPKTGHFSCYNPALAADRLQDLALVAAWAGSRPGTEAVHLVATDGWGPLAMLARSSLEGIARTCIDLEGFTYGDGSGPVPAALDLPGVCQVGGLNVAASLAAPHDLLLARATPDVAASAKAAYAAAGTPAALRLEDAPPTPQAVASWLATGQ
jgi:hypothetical protein